MGKTIMVYVCLYQGVIDNVVAFADEAEANEYWRGKVLEDYDSIEEYEKAFKNGMCKTEHHLWMASVKNH